MCFEYAVLTALNSYIFINILFHVKH